MTNQQPDNFFREKLADYHKPAPAGAWEKIELSLKKTDTKFAWWKVAASLLLLTAIGYILWSQTSKSNRPSISQTQSKVELPTLTSDPQKFDPSEKSQTPEEPKPKETSTKINTADEKVESKPVRTYRKKSSEVAAIVPAPAEESFQPVVTSPSGSVSDQVAPSIQPIKKSSSITLTITVKETDKYLDKESLAEATSKERKSSTFKKLLKKANELTSNQDPFGDLRVKKNEILALEFKNDKRGQNK